MGCLLLSAFPSFYSIKIFGLDSKFIKSILVALNTERKFIGIKTVYNSSLVFENQKYCRHNNSKDALF